MKAIISSKDNKFVKEAYALLTPSGRRKLGKYVIEGASYLHSGVEYVLVSNKCTITAPLNKYEHHIVEDSVFSRLTTTENSQGVLAVCTTPSHNLMDVLSCTKGIFIVCEGIRDPGNLGSIIRTAAASGCKGVFAIKGCTEAYSPKAVRAAAGATMHIPIVENCETATLLEMLDKSETRLVAAHLKADTPHYNADFTGKIAILIGNESRGLSDILSSSAHTAVKIPMPGADISLNAGNAAAILIYEAMRQNI